MFLERHYRDQVNACKFARHMAQDYHYTLVYWANPLINRGRHCHIEISEYEICFPSMAMRSQINRAAI
jgi:hypothetical protein